MSEFGTLLRKVREAHGLNNAQLSRKAGYDRKHIRQFETGDILPPDAEGIRTLCDAIGATPEERRQLLQKAYDAHLQRLNRRYPNARVVSN